MRYIGIDIGSSFIKSALLDTAGGGITCREKVPAHPRLPNRDPRVFELDAQLLCNTVRDIVDSYAARFPDVAGLLLSTQMHGFVYSDGSREDVYVSWQDARCLGEMEDGKSYIQYLRERIPAERMERCGVYLKPALGMCNLYALLHQSGGAANGTLYTIGSYIIHALTGNNACHLSNAAPLGLTEAQAGKWDVELLERLGLGAVALPAIAANDFAVCGLYRCPSNGRELAVYPDYGDQQAAVLGCLSGEGDALVNIATACQMARITGEFRPGNYEIRPYFEGKYIQVASNLPGGRNLDELIRFLGDVAELFGPRPEPAAIWDAAMTNVTGQTDGLSVDMRFYPTPDHWEGGAITGITPGSLRPDHLFSAAVSEIARAYQTAADTLFAGERPRRLVFSGGVSWKNPKLLKMVAEKLVLPHTLSAFPDEALAGLYRVALVCAGICRSLEDNLQLQRRLTIEGEGTDQ